MELHKLSQLELELVVAQLEQVRRQDYFYQH
jgi:hypothetical protein